MELLVVILVIVGTVFYFIPTILAFMRNTDNGGSVFVLNLLTGWTLIGLIAAFMLEATGKSYDEK